MSMRSVLGSRTLRERLRLHESELSQERYKLDLVHEGVVSPVPLGGSPATFKVAFDLFQG